MHTIQISTANDRFQVAATLAEAEAVLGTLSASVLYGVADLNDGH